MKAFMRSGEVLDIEEMNRRDYEEVKSLSDKKKENAKIFIADKPYNISAFRFIGDWCHNKKCSRFIKEQLSAHPLGEICEYDLTGECEDCAKKMWYRDVEYSKAMFGKVVCAKHVPENDLKGMSTELLQKN